MIVPLSLVALSVALYFECLQAGFTYDDHVTVLGNPLLLDWTRFDLSLHWERPVRTVTLLLDRYLFGDDPFGYHLHSLLWHLGNVLLLYHAASKVSSRPELAGIVAAFFSVLPVHVASVANISNRKELLCLFFCLASFLCYFSFLNRVGVRRWLWFIGASFGWLLAMGAKEIAIVLPFALASFEGFFLPRQRTFLLRFRVAMTILAIFAVGGAAVYLKSAIDFSNLNASRTFAGFVGELSFSGCLLNAPIAFFESVWLVLVPIGLSPDHVMRLSDSLLEPRAFLSWAGFIAAAVSPLFLRRIPLAAFGVAWFLLFYLPVSNLIPSSFLVAERYLYVPSAGFCLAAPALGVGGASSSFLMRATDAELNLHHHLRGRRADQVRPWTTAFGIISDKSESVLAMKIDRLRW